MAANLNSSCETICRGEEEMPMENSDEGCCPLACSTCQCCFCCFACPVDNKKIQIGLFETDLKNNPADGAFAVSGFASDCWQPPKAV